VEQQELERQWTNLDPHQTIWQGGPGEVIHSVMLQASQAAPAALTTLLPMGSLVRAGMTRGALAYVGATQAGLSVGQIANNISDEVMNTPEDKLQATSPKYAQLIAQGMDPAQARQQIVTEAQKYAPVIGGLVTGAISMVAGRFLTPVLSKEGASLGARLAGGAADQALQMGGIGGADYVARETAAHTYDQTRSPTIEGAARAAGEGAAVGAVTGAGFGAVLGHGRSQPELSANNMNPGETHSTMETSPENHATGAATESHTGMGATDEYEPIERNRTGETLGGTQEQGPGTFAPWGQERPLPKILGPGQADMNLPQGVAPDQAMAIQARHESAHWGEAPAGSGYRGAPPPEEPPPPPPNGMQEPNGPQGNLDLRGGQMNPPRPPPGPPANVPGQYNLPFQERLRGVGRVANQPMVEAPRTRADDLRERAAAPAAPDWDQPDLLRDNPIPGQLTTRGQRPMVRGNPDTPSAEPFNDIQAQLRDLRDPNHERGGVYLSADNMESLRQRGLLERVRDEAGPNAEPMVNFDEKGGALIAKSPEHAAQYAQMRDQKAASLEEILGHATGAGKGKPQEGHFVVQQHDDQGNVTRETGVATEAEAQQLAHQYTDVARGRTAVVTSAPAAILRRAQLIGLEKEHLATAKAEKGTQRAVSTALDRTATTSEALRARALRAANRDLGSGRNSPPRSREEAASRLTAEARQIHGEEKERAILGVPHPEDLTFANEGAAKEYARLHSEAMTQRLKARMAEKPEDREHARLGIEPTDRLLQAYINLHKPETRAKQVARAAVELSPPAVRRHMQENPKLVHPHQTYDTSAIEVGKHPTPDDVREMSDAQLDTVYHDVLNRSATPEGAVAHVKLTVPDILVADEGKRSRKETRIEKFFRDRALFAREQPAEESAKSLEDIPNMSREEISDLTRKELDALHYKIAQEIEKTPGLEKRSLLTKEDMIAEDEDVRSKKEKRIIRFFRSQARAEEMGGAHSQEFAATPRRALTERERQVNQAKSGRQRKLIGYETFDPEALMHTVETQREMERAQTPDSAREDRLRRYKDLSSAIDRGEKHLEELTTLKREDLAPESHKQKFDSKEEAEAFAQKQNADANTSIEQVGKKFRVIVTEKGESPLMAQRYMRELMQYGRVLRSQNLRSVEARSAATKFIQVMDALGSKNAVKRAHYLIKTFKTELARQDRAAMEANPLRSGSSETLERKVGLTNKALAKIEAERAARVAEGNPDAFVNALDREIAADNLRAGIREETPAAERSLRWDFGDLEKNPQTSLPFEGRLQPRQPEFEGATPNRFTQADEEETARLLRAHIAREDAEGLTVANQPERPKQEEYPFGYKSAGQQSADLNRETRGKIPYTRNAEANASRVGSALGELLEANGRAPVRGDKIVHEVLSNLRPGNPMHDLFTKFRQVVGGDTLVGYAPKDYFGGKQTFGNTRFVSQGPEIRINREHLDYLRATGRSPEAELAYTVAHELAHVATSGELYKNAGLARQMEGYLALARQHGDVAEHYGLKNIHEMVAEAYSNAKFRQFLRDIPAPHNTTLFDHIKNFFRSILGMDKTEQHKNLFDKIMSHEEQMFTGRRFVQTEGAKHVGELNREDAEGSHVANGYDRLLKALKTDRATVKDMTTGGQALLSAMAPRQMHAQFSKWFQNGENNPYDRYWRTYFKRAADNAVSMEKVGKLSNHWSNLEDRYGNDMANSVSKLMHDSSVYQFHPDLPLSHQLNEHLTVPEQQARHAAGEKLYNSLPKEWQDHYRAMKRYYAEEQRNSTDQIVLNGLHAMLTKGEDAAMSAKDFDAQYNAESVRKLALDTPEGLKKEFPSLDDSRIKVLAAMGALSNKPGPYFPLMRNGDFVVSAERKLGTKTFAEGADATKYMNEQRAKDPTLTVSKKVNEDGEYEVSTSEKEVRMAESRSEANQHRRDMVAQYGEGNVKPVRLKADLFKGEGTITTNAALDSLLRELNDNPAAQTAVKDFYLRSLGEQSFRKRELTRQNRRGVAVENQHRSFAQYGRSQSYYLAQLKHGRHLANAQGEVQAAVDAHTDESQISAVRLGQIARELSLRDEISRNPYKVAEWVRKGSALTQFMMITSPSHWFVRGAQPFVLSAPWLGARHGFSESVAALGRAQSMIADPLARESANSALGLKALFSRASAEHSFSIMDQVMQHVAARAGKDAPAINAMLQHLRENNLIDLSMATELSDISKGKSTGLSARVMDASRVMLHLIEVNNRVMTAIAARELGLRQGMTETQAIEHAADAINVTHNDYSYANTPRLFMAQAKGMLGGARPLMFQFMKYPQQVYGMMISSGLAALKGKTPAERAIGVKTLAGVLATHLLAAGAVGASISPIKWAFGALMAGASAMGATDEPYTVANALSGDTYDHMLRGVMDDLFGTELGELASKGLPAALGVDLSQRMALGATYSFHLKTDSDASTLGSVLESVGGPWLNVGENFYDAGKKFLAGEPIDAVEHMTPHIIRDLVKAGAMSQRGVVDNAGRTIIPADKLTGPQIFAQSLGFRPEEVAEKQNAANAMRTAQQNIMDQKKDLLAQYAKADEADARQDVYHQVQEFNAKHPGFAIDASTLLKAKAARVEAERELQQYGVRARNKQLPELQREGQRYNTQ
jgi:hypothetical protein